MTHEKVTGHQNVLYTFLVASTMLLAACSSGTLRDDQGRANYFGAIISDDTYAAHTGREIMRTGGNAVDAMIGMLMVSSVTSPGRSGLGALGRCMVWQPGESSVRLVSFYHSDNPGRDHPLLQGALVLHALGEKDWGDLIAPAASMARGGVLVSEDLYNDLRTINAGNKHDPGLLYYIPQDTKEPEVGRLVRHPLLARAFQRLGGLRSGPGAGNDQDSSAITNDIQVLDPEKGLRMLKGYDPDSFARMQSAVKVKDLDEMINLGGWSYYGSPMPSTASLGMRQLLQITKQRQNTGTFSWYNQWDDLIRDQVSIQKSWLALKNDVHADDARVRAFIYSDQDGDHIPVPGKRSSDSIFPTTVFGAVDYYGRAISCVVSLGKAFGQGRMDTYFGHYYADKTAKDALTWAGEWFVIDRGSDAFVALFLSGNALSVFPAAYTMTHTLLEGYSVRRALRQKRLSLSPDGKSIFHETVFDVKTHNDLLQNGFDLAKMKSLGNVGAIFCPAGLPRGTQHTICMAQADMRGSGSGFVRLVP